jgi:AraC-like DNA-binding protein
MCSTGRVPVPDFSRQALLDHLLDSIHLRSSLYARPELRAPWGFNVSNRGATFHIVAGGSCWLDVDRLEPIKLSAGEFVVLPRGDPHTLRDAPTTPAVSLADVLKTHGADPSGIFRAGGNGPLTKLVCGTLLFDSTVTDPLLAVMPRVLHVKRTGAGAAPWLYPTLVHLQSELRSGQAGAETVVARLMDVLFIQAVRAYFAAETQDGQAGWLAGLKDAQVGPALALLHRKLSHPWTVTSLAAQVGLSRSALALKFTELVGEPPLRYLTRLRLTAGASRLSASDDTIGGIAHGLGYASVSAFSKAFNRRFGMSPGRFRAARR